MASKPPNRKSLVQKLISEATSADKLFSSIAMHTEHWVKNATELNGNASVELTIIPIT